MAVPSSNYGISAIYSEANGGAPAANSNIAVSDLFKKSYFQGPTGSNTISYNAWGQYGSTSGADRIYGLTAKNTNNAWVDFSGLTYYYDNSSFKVAARLRNTYQPPPYPPPPPFYNNDITYEIWLYDSTFTYSYVVSGSQPAPATPGGFDQTITLSNTSTPIISIGYWEVRVTTNQFFPAGNAPITIDINGTNYVTSNVTDGNAQTTFNSGTYGTASVGSTGQGYTGIYFDIVV